MSSNILSFSKELQSMLLLKVRHFYKYFFIDNLYCTPNFLQFSIINHIHHHRLNFHHHIRYQWSNVFLYHKFHDKYCPENNNLLCHHMPCMYYQLSSIEAGKYYNYPLKFRSKWHKIYDKDSNLSHTHIFQYIHFYHNHQDNPHCIQNFLRQNKNLEDKLHIDSIQSQYIKNNENDRDHKLDCWDHLLYFTNNFLHRLIHIMSLLENILKNIIDKIIHQYIFNKNYDIICIISHLNHNNNCPHNQNNYQKLYINYSLISMQSIHYRYLYNIQKDNQFGIELRISNNLIYMKNMSLHHYYIQYILHRKLYMYFRIDNNHQHMSYIQYLMCHSMFNNFNHK